MSAGNVSHNSLVLRCTSHLHLEGKEEIKRWLMEELIQLHFQPWLCSLCTRYWPFAPVFPSSSVLKTHTHKSTRDTHWGLPGSHLLLAHWHLPDHHCFNVSILISNTRKNFTFSCSLQSHLLSVPVASPLFCITALVYMQDSGPPLKSHIILILLAV